MDSLAEVQRKLLNHFSVKVNLTLFTTFELIFSYFKCIHGVVDDVFQTKATT